jgi:hypothetical protein
MPKPTTNLKSRQTGLVDFDSKPTKLFFTGWRHSLPNLYRNKSGLSHRSQLHIGSALVVVDVMTPAGRANARK